MQLHATSVQAFAMQHSADTTMHMCQVYVQDESRLKQLQL